MKRMKRLISTLACTLTILIWICAPVQAEYWGTLQRDQDWIMNVDNGVAAGITAVTVHYLGSRLDEIEFRTVPAGDRVQLTFSRPGRGARRIIIEVDASKGQTVGVEVLQSASYTETVIGYGRLVFDVVQ